VRWIAAARGKPVHNQSHRSWMTSVAGLRVGVGRDWLEVAPQSVLHRVLQRPGANQFRRFCSRRKIVNYPWRNRHILERDLLKMAPAQYLNGREDDAVFLSDVSCREAGE
jgi:hypothetical protein